ncbi:MAG: hypothetical protein ING26_00115 [Roseomonas sp.]|nr:hypothetical protein [Roseomonas sp.]MCA3299912.1 hypothetical protein [Roseomonas sp.]
MIHNQSTISRREVWVVGVSTAIFLFFLLGVPLLYRLYLNYQDTSFKVDHYGRLVVDPEKGIVDFRKLNFPGYVCVGRPEFDSGNDVFYYKFNDTEKVPRPSRALKARNTNDLATAFDDLKRNNFFFILLDHNGDYREFSFSVAKDQGGKELVSEFKYTTSHLPMLRQCAPLAEAVAHCDSWWGVTQRERECFFAFRQTKN